MDFGICFLEFLTMSGIYLHIPFCKQACHYCNFHFSTSLKYKSDMVAAIIREIELQKDEWNHLPINTIYFGGGTPSLLTVSELEDIFAALNTAFGIQADAEITLEANPDDVTPDSLRDLRNTPINRLSIGIQSFSEADLQYMNRAHNAHEARACLENALQAGFTNLTADLIYGTPGMSDEQWRENLHTLFDLGIPHISCYALTVEERTALAHFIQKGKSAPVDDVQSARQFDILVNEMQTHNYEHYEISNFCKSGNYSRHNTAYWQGESYLGIGPAAHSFDGERRSWNVANNAQYIRDIQTGKIPCEIEELTPKDRFNEYLMTGFRTKWGCDLNKIRDFGEAFGQHFIEAIQPYLDEKIIIQEGDIFRLSDKGKFLSDGIISDLFLISDF